MIIVLFLTTFFASADHYCSDLSDTNRFQECVYDLSQRIQEIKGSLNAEIFNAQGILDSQMTNSNELSSQVYNSEKIMIEKYKPQWESTIEEVVHVLLSKENCGCSDLELKRKEFYQLLTQILNTMIGIQDQESGVLYSTKKTVNEFIEYFFEEEENVENSDLPSELRKEYALYKSAVENYNRFYFQLLKIDQEDLP